jgi:hypothetical protein
MFVGEALRREQMPTEIKAAVWTEMTGSSEDERLEINEIISDCRTYRDSLRRGS